MNKNDLIAIIFFGLIGFAFWLVWFHQNNIIINKCMDNLTKCQAEYFKNN